MYRNIVRKGNFLVRIYCSTVTRNSTALDAKVVFTDLKNTNLKFLILVICMAPVVDTQEQSIFQYSSGLSMKRRSGDTIIFIESQIEVSPMSK